MRAKLLLFSLVLILFFTGSVIAQGTTVKGVVTSAEDGSPLPGANVIVKNTQKGASTDIDGIYILEDVSAQDTLVFMYVGYSDAEEIVGDRELINARLTPEAFSADAIVVIGYGTQQRKDLTNAIGTLSPQDFNRGAVTDPMQLAQARMPGVKIVTGNGDLGFAPMIRIRGGTSVSASNEPMYVIDGVPVENVSATPTFNPEGTSDGTGEDNPAGGLRDNPLSNLDPNDIESIDILKDASSAATYGARGGNGVILITTKSGTPGGSALTYRGYSSISSQYGEYDLLNAQEYRDYAAQVGATPEMGSSNTDWQDAITRDAFSHSHTLAYSSGSANTSYLVSVNYLDEQGIVLNSDRQRISGRFNIQHQMYDNTLRLGMRVNPSYIKRNNTPYRQIGGFRGGLFTNVLKHNPTLPVKNSDGSYYAYASPDIRNPVAMVELIEDESEIMRIFANFNAEYDFIPELTGRINLGFDRSDASRAIFQPNAIPYAATFGGRADIESSDRQNVLFEATAEYKKLIGSKHDLKVLAGYTYQDFENSAFGTTGRGFVTDAWSYNNLGGGSDFTVRPYSIRADNRLISFLGRAIYSLDDKYLFNLALRYEGSSRFGEGNKWGAFPSAAVAWRLSAEPFLKDAKSLNDLKLRLSYGITGNEDIGNYNSLVILGP
jgi:iron complex outermembrane receptor protein